MDPQNYDSSGSNVYTLTYRLIPTCIHIVYRDLSHLIDGDQGTAD